MIRKTRYWRNSQRGAYGKLQALADCISDLDGYLVESKRGVPMLVIVLHDGSSCSTSYFGNGQFYRTFTNYKSDKLQDRIDTFEVGEAAEVLRQLSK